jgi:hypothetical protein
MRRLRQNDLIKQYVCGNGGKESLEYLTGDTAWCVTYLSYLTGDT